MKTTAQLLVYALVAYVILGTETFAQSPKSSRTVQVWGSYLANRVSREITQYPTIWTADLTEWNSGLYLYWLEIHDLKDTDWSTGSQGYDETNVSLGYKWNIGEYTLKTEATIINLHPIERWFDDDLYAFDVYLSRTFDLKWHGSHTLTPELRFVWIANTNNTSGGSFGFMPTLYHQWQSPFGIERLSLKTRLAISADGGLNKNDPGIFLQAETGLNWKIGKFTLTFPGIKCFTPFTQQHDGRETAASLFGGVSLPW